MTYTMTRIKKKHTQIIHSYTEHKEIGSRVKLIGDFNIWQKTDPFRIIIDVPVGRGNVHTFFILII